MSREFGAGSFAASGRLHCFHRAHALGEVHEISFKLVYLTSHFMIFVARLLVPEVSFRWLLCITQARWWARRLTASETKVDLCFTAPTLHPEGWKIFEGISWHLWRARCRRGPGCSHRVLHGNRNSLSSRHFPEMSSGFKSEPIAIRHAWWPRMWGGSSVRKMSPRSFWGRKMVCLPAHGQESVFNCRI